jgi:esterase/lipase superfamily enzyme
MNTICSWLVLIAAAILASACSPRGEITFDPGAAEIGLVQEILVATTRAPSRGPDVLSTKRSPNLAYFDFDVSVPPDRLPGSVSFPSDEAPDPERHFLTVSADRLPDTAAFAALVNLRLASRAPEDREVVVFVHGFNTNFAEGLYRHAQMAHDFGSPGVSVNYAWPSAADFRGYATDRESVLFARDGLESLLATLSRTSARRIVVVAHSMGAHLVMEALRQMEIRGSPAFADKLASVVLFAPDLDIDVFRGQIAFAEAWNVPVYVFVSNRDRALQFSSRIRGGATRLGAVRDTSQLSDLPIIIVDISRINDGQDVLMHSKAATSPVMIALVGGMGAAGLEMFRQEDRRPTSLESGLLAVQGVADAVTGPVGR